MNKPQTELLIKAILELNDPVECKALLEDLFSAKELISFETRLLVAKGINRGQKYHEISKATGASTATIAKIKDSYNYGQDGLKRIISRLGD